MKWREVVDQLLPVALPNIKRHNNNHRAQVLLACKLGVEARKYKGGNIYLTFREAAELYKPREYRNGTFAERKGIITTVKQASLRLTDISANMPGRYALTVVPATRQLLADMPLITEMERDGRVKDAVALAETALSTHKGNEYTGVLITTNPNGIVPVAYTNRNKRCAEGKEEANRDRRTGWEAAGLLSSPVLKHSLYTELLEDGGMITTIRSLPEKAA